MKNSHGEHFTENTRVRLRKGKTKQSAVIIGWLPDVKGGAILSERLDGFTCWNVEELKRAKIQDSK